MATTMGVWGERAAYWPTGPAQRLASRLSRAVALADREPFSFSVQTRAPLHGKLVRCGMVRQASGPPSIPHLDKFAATLRRLLGNMRIIGWRRQDVETKQAAIRAGLKWLYRNMSGIAHSMLIRWWRNLMQVRPTHPWMCCS